MIAIQRDHDRDRDRDQNRDRERIRERDQDRERIRETCLRIMSADVYIYCQLIRQGNFRSLFFGKKFYATSDKARYE